MIFVTKKSTGVRAQFLVDSGSPVSKEWTRVFPCPSFVYCQKLISEATAGQGMANILPKFFHALDNKLARNLSPKWA